MSQQSSELPVIEEAGSRNGGKKAKGKFEVWMSYGRKDWFRWRTYKTRALAEENALAFQRKWNRGDDPFFKFEVRCP
jgi:hypothetical protein